MTVHGAKGLQAPLVVVPETAGLPKDDGTMVWADDQKTGRAVRLWAPRKESAATRSTASAPLASSGKWRSITGCSSRFDRAEDRLLVCGWHGAHAPKEECWHNLVQRGFEAAGAEAQAFRPWEGKVLRLRAPQVLPAEIAVHAARRGHDEDLPGMDGAAPGWIAAPPPPEPPRPLPLAPSRPEGVELGTVPASDLPLAERDAGGNRFRRGQLIHSLLQHLPSVPAAVRRATAIGFLDKPGHRLPAGEAERVADEVLAVIAHPDLGPLFGRMAERRCHWRG